MVAPQMTAAEMQTRQTFGALMWALSYPGRTFPLHGKGLSAFGMIANALVDLETSYYSSHAELQPLLARTGGRARSPDAALYQFYPEVTETTLAVMSEAPVGRYLYPDESATLVIGCTFGLGRELRLGGPGIPTRGRLWVTGIPDSFWTLRNHACRYPLGWDIFLVSHDEVAGLPRTTQIEVK